MTTPAEPLQVDRGETPPQSPEELSDLLSRQVGPPQSNSALQSWLDGGGEIELARPHVSAWLEQHGTSRDAEYLLKSWLDSGGEHDLVRPHVAAWLEQHAALSDAAFLLTAWLGAEGDKDLVRPFVKLWLASHGNDRAASFVLGAWLKAKGNANWLETYVKGWMSRYGRTLPAVYLFHAWAQSNGNPALVRDWAIDWIPEHRDAPETALIAKFLARQPDLPLETVRHLLAWCQAFQGSPAALRALCYLNQHLLRPEISSEVTAACSAVIEAALAQEKLPSSGRGFLPLLFASTGREPRLREALRPLFLQWLRHPLALVPRPRWPENLPEHLLDIAESRSLLLYVTEAVAAGSLDLDSEEDRQALLRLFAWIGTWSPGNRQAARDFLAECAAHAERADYPAR